MIRFIGIDYEKKYLIDLNDCIVKTFDMVAKQWVNLDMNQITKTSSMLRDTIILSFKDDKLIYQIEVGQKSAFVSCSVYDTITTEIGFIEKQKYAYDLDTMDDLFVVDEEGIPVLNKETFYSITGDTLKKLCLDSARIEYLINFINSSIKQNKEETLIIKEYADLIAKLVYKNDVELEKLFENKEEN